jgi:hypothetical protein
VSLNDIAIHDGGMAGLNLEWDAILISDRQPVFGVLNLDGKSVVAHIITPAATAASGGFPVDGYQRFILAVCSWLIGPSRATSNQQQACQ